MTQGFTNEISIPVPVTQGGTGRIATTANNVLFSSATNTIGEVASVANGVLAADGSGVPVYTTVPYPRAVGWTSYTPTVTLVGGAGNTVPTFSTQSGRYQQVGNVVFVQLNFLNASGGTAGAGTGSFTVALPVAAGASISTTPISALGLIATTVVYPVCAVFTASTATCTFTYINTVTTASAPVQGATFAAGARYLQIQFFYEV